MSTSRRRWPRPCPGRFPSAYRDEAGLTLSGAVARTHEAGFLPDILERSLHDGLRHHAGGAYGLWSGITEIDNQQAVVAAGAEVVPEMLPSLARASLEVTQRLSDEGVPREWVQEAVDARLRVLESPAAMVETALEAAYAVLRDQVPVSYDELREQLRDTDPARVDQAARELHASLLVGLPDAAPLGRTLPAVTFPDARPSGTGQKHSHVNWPADLTTFSADEPVAERVTGTMCRAMRIKDIVALLAWRDGARHLIGQDGSVLEMEPREWMRGKDLTKALDAAVPDELHVPMSDRAVTFHRMSTTERAAVAFARFANTRTGLASMLAVVTVLAAWALVAGHRIVGVALVLLAAALGSPPVAHGGRALAGLRLAAAVRHSLGDDLGGDGAAHRAAGRPDPRVVRGRRPRGHPGPVLPRLPRHPARGLERARRRPRGRVRLVAANRPGYGASTPAAPSYRRVADDTAELADSLGIEHFGVLGMSVGGTFALACAALLPRAAWPPRPRWWRPRGETPDLPALEQVRPEFLEYRASGRPRGSRRRRPGRRAGWRRCRPEDRSLVDGPAAEVAAAAREAILVPDGYLPT